MRTRAQLDAAQARLDLEYASIDAREKKYGAQNQFKHNDVITFDYRYQRGGKKYSYAAVYIEGSGWYTTGPAAPKEFSWDELTDWWERGVLTNLRIVTRKRRIV